MFARRLVDAVPLWLTVGIPVAACCFVTPPDTKVEERPDAGLPAESIPGEHRGPTIEEVFERLGRSDPESVMSLEGGIGVAQEPSAPRDVRPIDRGLRSRRTPR